MAFILAMDQGTTSSRAILFNDAGEILVIKQREFRQSFPASGWVEHDPEEIWSSQRDVALEALKEAKLQPADVSAIGITNQRETVVAWDRQTGEPIYPAIVWQDRRTADICQRLRTEGYEDLVRRKTGLLLDPYFSGTKFAWILEHVTGARAKAEAGELACGTIDSWLLYKLTGGKCHLTDATNASRTLLMDIHTAQWDMELAQMLNVPLSVLPEIRSCSEVYDEVAGSQLSGIPIAGIAGDQQAALFGQTCFEVGTAKNTYGTGSFMLVNTGTTAVESTHKLITTVAWQVEDRTEYALEGSIFVTGAAVGWLRDGLGIIRSSSEIEALASSVPDSGDVYLVPAFAGLGAPHWDPYARGMVIGISRGTTAGHLARATLESIALQVADLAEAMHHDTGRPLTELRADGGAAVNDLLLQMQADLLQVPVVRPRITETTALGAAYLAGLAVGVWPDRRAIAHHWQEDRRFEPQMSRDQAESKRNRWSAAVERAKGWYQES